MKQSVDKWFEAFNDILHAHSPSYFPSQSGTSTWLTFPMKICHVYRAFLNDYPFSEPWLSAKVLQKESLLKVWYTLMELGSREEDKIRINISFSYAKVTIELMKKVTLNAYSRTKSTPWDSYWKSSVVRRWVIMLWRKRLGRSQSIFQLVYQFGRPINEPQKFLELKKSTSLLLYLKHIPLN